MKLKKKIIITIVCICFGIPVLAFIVPAPIEGYWCSNFVSCLCNSHNFLQFDNGNVYEYKENHEPHKTKFGMYKKISWNKYSLYNEKGEIGVMKSGWIFGNSNIYGENFLCIRDFSIFKDKKIMEYADRYDLLRKWSSQRSDADKASDGKTAELLYNK